MKKTDTYYDNKSAIQGIASAQSTHSASSGLEVTTYRLAGDG
ncbi:hypothetical protein AB4256_01750 [Vibrio breoganii]